MQTIYIVDYDADIMDILCNWLELHGYKVKCFSNYEQLLNRLSVSHPDCIILDCLYGTICLASNICHTIRQVYNYTGKILLTSTSNLSEMDLKECKTTHAITKPFDLSELLKVVNSLVSGSLKRFIV